MNGRKLAYLASLPALWALYALSFLGARNPRRIAFGSMQDQFSENSRYLFLSLSEIPPPQELEIAWISGSVDIVRTLRARGLTAHHRWSPRGIAYCLTASTYVTSAYLSDVNFWCSGGCRHLSLWHGIPLKKIERDIAVGPLSNQFRPGLAAVLAHIALPQKFRRPDHLISPCAYTDELFSRAFGVSASAIVRSIYPRSMHLLRRRRTAAPKASRTVVFCPTWRDRSGAEDARLLGDCIAALYSACEHQGFQLRVKLHPNLAKREDLRAIVARHALQTDLYDALADASLVITDYSSILFECILARIPLLLYSYDGDMYERCSRDLYFDSKQVLSDVWVRELTGLDLGTHIANAEPHLDGYRAQFGFYEQDAVTSLLAPSAPTADSRTTDLSGRGAPATH